MSHKGLKGKKSLQQQTRRSFSKNSCSYLPTNTRVTGSQTQGSQEAVGFIVSNEVLQLSQFLIPLSLQVSTNNANTIRTSTVDSWPGCFFFSPSFSLTVRDNPH